MSSSLFMRIGCVQYSPLHGQPKTNAETVQRLTSSLQPGELDILMLPEMALSGYVFKDAEEVAPLLEDPCQGTGASPSLALARDLSTRLGCYVSIGFPSKATCFEAAARKETSKAASTNPPYDKRPNDTKPAIVSTKGHAAYNASLLLDAQGQIVHTFRKHFNYETDKVWATEGPGFETVDLPNIGRVCVAICMDINREYAEEFRGETSAETGTISTSNTTTAYDYKAPFEAFELARFCQERKVDVLLMNMAWLASNEGDLDDEEGTDGLERTNGRRSEQDAQASILSSASLRHCNYLATRLTPCIIGASQTEGALHTTAAASPAAEHKLAFVTCNRTGFERGFLFCGSSFALDITSHQPPELVGMMGTNEQGVAVFEVRRSQAIVEAEP